MKKRSADEAFAELLHLVPGIDLDMSASELIEAIVEQLKALQELAEHE